MLYIASQSKLTCDNIRIIALIYLSAYALTMTIASALRAKDEECEATLEVHEEQEDCLVDAGTYMPEVYEFETRESQLEIKPTTCELVRNKHKMFFANRGMPQHHSEIKDTSEAASSEYSFCFEDESNFSSTWTGHTGSDVEENSSDGSYFSTQNSVVTPNSSSTSIETGVDDFEIASCICNSEFSFFSGDEETEPTLWTYPEQLATRSDEDSDSVFSFNYDDEKCGLSLWQPPYKVSEDTDKDSILSYAIGDESAFSVRWWPETPRKQVNLKRKPRVTPRKIWKGLRYLA